MGLPSLERDNISHGGEAKSRGKKCSLTVDAETDDGDHKSKYYNA